MYILLIKLLVFFKPAKSCKQNISSIYQGRISCPWTSLSGIHHQVRAREYPGRHFYVREIVFRISLENKSNVQHLLQRKNEIYSCRFTINVKVSLAAPSQHSPKLKQTTFDHHPRREMTSWIQLRSWKKVIDDWSNQGGSGWRDWMIIRRVGSLVIPFHYQPKTSHLDLSRLLRSPHS